MDLGGVSDQIKGTDLLVRALPRVASRFPEVRCVIVGGDDHGMKSRLEILAGEWGVSRNVTFAGPLPDPRVAVSLMDVFVLPSRADGLPRAVVEAMVDLVGGGDRTGAARHAPDGGQAGTARG